MTHGVIQVCHRRLHTTCGHIQVLCLPLYTFMDISWKTVPAMLNLPTVQCSKKRPVCTFKKFLKICSSFYWIKHGKKRKLEYFSWKKIYFCYIVEQFCVMIFQFEQLKFQFNIDKFSPPMIILLARKIKRQLLQFL